MERTSRGTDSHLAGATHLIESYTERIFRLCLIHRCPLSHTCNITPNWWQTSAGHRQSRPDRLTQPRHHRCRPQLQ
jgi:hypothetical protein